MFRHALYISAATSIASGLADGEAQPFLTCEEVGQNDTVESQECCRWLRAWHAWQECDQWGQDCATEEALTNIEKKVCSDQCASYLDEKFQEKRMNQTNGTKTSSALRPFCAVHAQPAQCPPLRLGNLDVDGFPWVVVVVCVAAVSFGSVFFFHRRCLAKTLVPKSERAKDSIPALNLLEQGSVNGSLRDTATAAPDNPAIAGTFGTLTQETIEQTPSMSAWSAAQDDFVVEHESKEMGITAPRRLSLPPAPAALPTASFEDSTPSSSTVPPPVVAPSPSSLPPPPPALPPDPTIMKPVAPPPNWHLSSPAGHAEIDPVSSSSKTTTTNDLRQNVSQSSERYHKWPPGLSALWALRRAFICTALVGAVLRASLLILRVCIPDMAAAPIAVELTLLALQVLWVKGPAPPETGTELPTEVTHGGPKGMLPRFGVFAMTTAVLEVASVLTSSQVSLYEACGFLPILLNILSAPVTVARCYSAFLALKVQDEADKLARRIVPEFESPPTTVDTNLGDICIDLSEPTVAGKQMSPMKLLKEKNNSEQQPTKNRRSCRRNCSRCTRSRNEPKFTKRPRTRAVVVVGSTCAVLCSVVLALTLALAKPEAEDNDELPSSCVTRQNSTTTCEFYEQLGSAIGGTDPLEACCQGCDKLEGCQAWIFDSATTRCRWVRFTEDPCATTPDKASCRCMTHPGGVFGYRPTRKVVMIAN